MSYHFGIRWQDIETMPAYERGAYLAALETVRHELRQMNGGR